MNLFRSEEHANNWSGHSESDQILPVAAVVGLLQHPTFRDRLDPDYYAKQPQLVEEFFAMMAG